MTLIERILLPSKGKYNGFFIDPKENHVKILLKQCRESIYVVQDVFDRIFHYLSKKSNTVRIRCLVLMDIIVKRSHLFRKLVFDSLRSIASYFGLTKTDTFMGMQNSLRSYLQYKGYSIISSWKNLYGASFPILEVFALYCTKSKLDSRIEQHASRHATFDNMAFLLFQVIGTIDKKNNSLMVALDSIGSDIIAVYRLDYLLWEYRRREKSMKNTMISQFDHASIIMNREMKNKGLIGLDQLDSKILDARQLTSREMDDLFESLQASLRELESSVQSSSNMKRLNNIGEHESENEYEYPKSKDHDAEWEMEINDNDAVCSPRLHDVDFVAVADFDVNNSLNSNLDEDTVDVTHLLQYNTFDIDDASLRDTVSSFSISSDLLSGHFDALGVQECLHSLIQHLTTHSMPFLLEWKNILSKLQPFLRYFPSLSIDYETAIATTTTRVNSHRDKIESIQTKFHSSKTEKNSNLKT